jgi:hypothetical protein
MGNDQYLITGATGKTGSQKPRSLDSKVAGNQDSEAYRQASPFAR